tara:strand:- start:1987 stop:3090 length:1104 start_codon:yes stop_codon:yes gene_type:complete
VENKKITYVFISGRKERLSNDKEIFAKEFFYGFNYFKDKYEHVKIIEFKEIKTLFNLFYKILNKISDLPFYGNYLINKENYKILKNTDELVLTNQKTAFSILPLLLIVKIRKKMNSNVFIMGLFGKKMKYKIKSIFRNLFIYILILSSKKLIFLGKGEYEFAIKKYKKYKHKFELLPFSVDLKFWKPKDKDYNTKEILFVGNDGMRDYEFLDTLIHNLQEYKFNIVSKIFTSSSNHENIKLYSGSWGSKEYSDSFIHNLYKDASLTILPLKNSLQPSGQSVALQSIASGTPVLISKTEGFWDPDKFIDNENIYFLESNNLTLWVDKIKEILDSPDLRQKVRQKGRDTIEANYDLVSFHKEVERIILS